MLSGESSVGKHPVTAVKVMDEIVGVAQGHMPKRNPTGTNLIYGSPNTANQVFYNHAASQHLLSFVFF